MRTLPASVSPVVLGIGVAWFGSPIPTGCPAASLPWWAVVGPVVACVIVALGFQIGSNYANDYSDGVRGTDDARVGPMRLVGSGKANPASVRRAAWICFAIACVAGLALVVNHVMQGWLFFQESPTWLAVRVCAIILVGAACVLAAWFYTGGRRPYGYLGLGEVFVFIFFGLVATLGTAYMTSPWDCAPCLTDQVCSTGPSLRWVPALIAGVVMGCFATAILVANNLRDIPTDKQSGKVTLAVRLGDTRTRWLYVGLLAAALVGIILLGFVASPGAWLGVAGLGLVIGSCARVIHGAQGRDLIAALKWTGLSELATAILIVVGMWMVGGS